MRDRRQLILGDTTIPATHKLVALALMDAERDDGVIVVKQATLSTFIGITPPYANKVISELVEWGVLEKFRITDPSMWEEDVSYKQNAYRFIGRFAAPQGVEV